MYKLLTTPIGEPINVIFRKDDGAFIPMDESNRDYQEYLKWVTEGNTPEPADE
jgi:hypothetical protein